jgi:hypothetical protein
LPVAATRADNLFPQTETRNYADVLDWMPAKLLATIAAKQVFGGSGVAKPLKNGARDGTRTRDLCRDRAAL